MAKGNLFLGMGRGSVGDVTFYRADGQQLSRARNRKPRNPKSNAQLIQRAISATIVQAYKAGSIIFDHSFEGKSVPSGSQRAFLSTNMRKLRERVLNEINSTVANTTAAVVSPRSVFPVPNAYRVSEGALIQTLFKIDTDGTVTVVDAVGAETLGAYLTRLGVSAGDIFTIVCFAVDGTHRKSDLTSPQCLFGFMRLTVKESAVGSSTPMSSAKYGDLFEIDTTGATIATSEPLDTGISIDMLNIGAAGNGAIGVIRSQENSGLRSTCDLFVIPTDSGWGVAPPNLLASWSQDSGSVDSELILEGGDI